MNFMITKLHIFLLGLSIITVLELVPFVGMMSQFLFSNVSSLVFYYIYCTYIIKRGFFSMIGEKVIWATSICTLVILIHKQECLLQNEFA